MATATPAAERQPAEELLQVLAIPPAARASVGARVEHLLAPRDGLLSELLTEALALPEGAADLLLRFGAVHTCPVPPAPPTATLQGLPPDEAEALLARRTAALARAGNSSQARTPQRAAVGACVTKHSYIRAHVHPKRFPACYGFDWRDRVVADAPEYVVVSKPAGVPAAPTIDNLLESAPACAAAALGLPAPLLVTHRLDQCTEGLLVLGKTRAFVRAFNELVRRSGGSGGKCSSSGGSPEASAAEQLADAAGSNDSGSASGTSSPLRKFYRAVTAAPPPLGLLRHHLSIQQRHEGLPQFSVAHEAPVPGSLLSELRVLEVAPVRLSAAALQQWGVAPSGASGSDGAHECLIELLTGRTHQIRAQLSAAGCPLLGDPLYQPLASAELRRRLFVGDPCGDMRGGRERLLEEPAGGIGLQACRLLVADACMGGSAGAPAAFEAPPPWWRA